MYGAQSDTIKLQINYDTKLENATYDAIQAFQANTVNSSTSDLTNSKIRDIEAAANSFFTYISAAFNMTGYNADILQNYVPALVFTLYDGFYIYSPFENTLDQETVDSLEEGSTYTGEDGERVTELKPYIYYSCRYKKGANLDITITYSLDNYITIQGYDANGNPINDAGYLLSDVNYNSSTGVVTYRGIEIEPEENLTENVGNLNSQDASEYPYIKINGVKYYYDQSQNSWFMLLNGERTYGQGPFTLDGNDMGYRYYKEAYEFTYRVMNVYGLSNLSASDAVDDNGNPLQSVTDEDGNVIYDFVNSGIGQIFSDTNGDIEEPDSNFNQHRMAVIRYVIESNLTVALANYNNGTYNFRMPKLAEEDWDRILNNVSLISFLQGLNIGGKVYNGYAVVNNNKNEEVVTEDSIYITSDDGYFHRVTHEGLTVSANSKGIFNIDFERKSIVNDQSDTIYYYPQEQLGCYDCYVSQTHNIATSNIYEYLDGLSDKTLAKIYYTALGRERYSMYKVFRNPEEHLNEFRQ